MSEEPLDDPFNHPEEDQHKGQAKRMLLKDLIHARAVYLEVLKKAEHSTFGFFVKKNSNYTEEDCLAEGFSIEDWNELRELEAKIDQRYGELFTGHEEWLKRTAREAEIEQFLKSSKVHLEMMEGLFGEMSVRWFTVNKQGFRNARDAAVFLKDSLDLLLNAYIIDGDEEALEKQVTALCHELMGTIDDNHDDSFEIIREVSKLKDVFFVWFGKLLERLKIADVSEPVPALSMEEYDRIERNLHKTTGSEAKKFQVGVKKFFDAQRSSQAPQAPQEEEGSDSDNVI
jgi:hypothetical protein